jgi:hypothetical protein
MSSDSFHVKFKVGQDGSMQVRVMVASETPEETNFADVGLSL